MCLELGGLLAEGLQIGNAEPAGPAGEELLRGQPAQGREATSTLPADHQPPLIHLPRLDQRTGRVQAVADVGAKGAGYGWLLVIAGTLASIGGNVAHAQHDLVARAIAAAIPLAVLAMLEGLKGDAGEVTRLATQAAAGDGAGTLEPAGQRPQATTVRRSNPSTNHHHATGTFSPRRRALPAGPTEPTANGTVGARLQAAYAQPRPDGQPWTARTLAEAAGCGRSSAAAFLQRHRQLVQERTE
jgi:hypothetical protein